MNRTCLYNQIIITLEDWEGSRRHRQKLHFFGMLFKNENLNFFFKLQPYKMKVNYFTRVKKKF